MLSELQLFSEICSSKKEEKKARDCVSRIYVLESLLDQRRNMFSITGRLELRKKKKKENYNKHHSLSFPGTKAFTNILCHQSLEKQTLWTHLTSNHKFCGHHHALPKPVMPLARTFQTRRKICFLKINSFHSSPFLVWLCIHNIYIFTHCVFLKHTWTLCLKIVMMSSYRKRLKYSVQLHLRIKNKQRH